MLLSPNELLGELGDAAVQSVWKKTDADLSEKKGKAQAARSSTSGVDSRGRGFGSAAESGASELEADAVGGNSEMGDGTGSVEQEEVKRKNEERERKLAELKERNEKIERENKEVIARREKIKESLDKSILLIDAALAGGKLSDSERARYERVKAQIIESKSKTLVDIKKPDYTSYIEQAKDNDGKVVASRETGIQVQDLLRIITEQGTRLQRNYAEIKRQRELLEQVEAAKQWHKAEKANPDNEIEQKRAWCRAYEQLPDGSFKQKVLNEIKTWENSDGRTYVGEERELQLGEATRQLVAKELAKPAPPTIDVHKHESHVQKLEQLKNVLGNTEYALPYFAYHYGMTVDQLERADLEKQKKFTADEARKISTDPEYKKFVIESLQAKGRLTRDQRLSDYELAQHRLQDRLYLNLGTLKKPQTEADLSIEPAVQQSTPPRVRVAKVGGNPTPVEPVPVIGGIPVNIENRSTSTPVLEPGTPTIPIQPTELNPTIPTTPTVEIVTPIIPPPEKIEIKAKIRDASEIAMEMAWAAAEERVRKEEMGIGKKEEGGFFSKIKNKIKEIRAKGSKFNYYKDELQKIQSSQSLMNAIKMRASGQHGYSETTAATEKHYYEILDAIVGPEAEKSELGEKISEDPAIKAAVANMFYMHATGKWIVKYQGKDERERIEAFVKDEIVSKLNGKQWTGDTDRQDRAKGYLYASNFYEMAQNYKKQITEGIEAAKLEHGPENEQAIVSHLQGMMNLDLQLALNERNMKNDMPKGKLAWYEKMIDWTEKGGAGRRILGKIATNPFVVGAAPGVTKLALSKWARYGVITGTTALGFAGMWVPLGVGAVMGGAMKAWQRSRELKYKIAEEQRAETLGGKSTLLEEREGMRYDSMDLRTALSNVTTMSGKSKDDLSDADKAYLAEILTRLEIEKKEHRDLFKVDQTEGNLYGTTIVAKSKLRQSVESVMKETGLTAHDLEGLMREQRIAFTKEIKDSNEVLTTYRHRKMGKEFLKGAAQGIVGGLIMQEATYRGGRLLGLGFAKNRTNVEHLYDWWKGNHPDVNINSAASLLGGNSRGIPTGILNPSLPPEIHHASFGSADWWKSHGFSFEHLNQDLHHPLEGEQFDVTGHHAGNEMMGHFHPGKDGTVTTKFGMLENIKNNIINTEPGHAPDGTIDPRASHLFGDVQASTNLEDYANNFHNKLKFVIYPTAEMAHNHDGIIIGSPDEHGNLVIPEKYKGFFDASGKLRGGAVAAWGSEGSDNKFHILASVKGNGSDFDESAFGIGNEKQGLATGDGKAGIEKTPFDGQRYALGDDNIREYDNAYATVLPHKKLKYYREGEEDYTKYMDEKDKKQAKEAKKTEAAKAKSGGHGGHDGHGGGSHGPEGDHGPKLSAAAEKRKQVEEELKKVREEEKDFFNKKKQKEMIDAYGKLPSAMKDKHKANLDVVAYFDAGQKDGWQKRGDGVYTRAQYVKEMKKVRTALEDWKSGEEERKTREKAEAEEMKKRLDDLDKLSADIKKAEQENPEEAKGLKKKFKQSTGGIPYFADYSRDKMEKLLKKDPSVELPTDPEEENRKRKESFTRRLKEFNTRMKREDFNVKLEFEDQAVTEQLPEARHAELFDHLRKGLRDVPPKADVKILIVNDETESPYYQEGKKRFVIPDTCTAEELRRLIRDNIAKAKDKNPDNKNNQPTETVEDFNNEFSDKDLEMEIEDGVDEAQQGRTIANVKKAIETLKDDLGKDDDQHGLIKIVSPASREKTGNGVWVIKTNMSLNSIKQELKKKL